MTNLNPCIDPEKIAYYREAIRVNEGHLDDCKNRRPTDYLRALSKACEGTEDIDFDCIAKHVAYGLEEDYDCLWKAERGWSLMCFAIPE